jgi:hypothetical protein
MTDACDLFLTHAWRYHDDWKRMVDVLNTQGIRAWRNFSLPWYDPALDPRTPEGGQIVRRHLEVQIVPCDAVLLLSGVYEQASCRKWVDMEIEMARRHRKLIIAIPAIGATEPTPEARAVADAVLGWDPVAIMDLARRCKAGAVPAAPDSGRNVIREDSQCS